MLLYNKLKYFTVVKQMVDQEVFDRGWSHLDFEANHVY